MTGEQLAEWVAECIEKGIEWKKEHSIKERPDATVYVGMCNNWRFVIISFDISDQGFKAGSLGYDGTATHYTVIHLPRELSTQLGKDAEEKTN